MLIVYRIDRIRGPIWRKGNGNQIFTTNSSIEILDHKKYMKKNFKIIVVGGSGLIGKKLVKDLRQQGHEVMPASPSSGVNTVTGEGLSNALKGAQVVVDVSNAPSWE